MSELELTLGDVDAAERDAAQSVSYADQTRDGFQRFTKRTTQADALHQAGRETQAEALFREAEAMLAKSQPPYTLLYSVPGFRYCDLLLAESERAAWRKMQALDVSDPPRLQAVCRAVAARAVQTGKWREEVEGGALLDIAFDALTISRAAFYEAILRPDPSNLAEVSSELAVAVQSLRQAGTTHHIPRGLLTRAWCFVAEEMEQRRQGEQTQAAECQQRAREDLDEARGIAERGPMKLHMADVYLYRARLFFRADKYPWESPQKDLAEAERLIEECGYGRRREELTDAKRAILGE